MNYLKIAIECSRKSLKEGGFPAGAVLVTKIGNVYKSGKSVAYLHGEIQVIDEAIKSEGYPLDGAQLYSSMESCLMCSSKMYWAGITDVEYVIPKAKVNAEYAYEDARDIDQTTSGFFKKLVKVNNPKYLSEALALYDEWVKEVES